MRILSDLLKGFIMIRSDISRLTVAFVAAVTVIAADAFAQQYGGGTGGGPAPATGGAAGTGGAAAGYNFHQNYHIGFDRPEAWGLKYFASASLLSGLPAEPSPENHRVGSITVGVELGWMPGLDSGQQRIGFFGKAPEDLNKAPIFARPVVRVGLPWKLTAVAAGPPPFELFGVTPHLLAFGLERPVVERPQWEVGWRGYGQVGSVKGAFTCPQGVLPFAPGSANNPTECVGRSADLATLRYVGMEFQFSHRLVRAPRVIPHVAIGGNFIDGAFQVHAPVEDGLDETRLWTRGGTLSTSGGLTFLVTRRMEFTVDAFYSPLWVQRAPGAPTTNDGLFNVRAMLGYAFGR